MKKFEGILLCSDLDGTLVRGDGSISKENKEAIAYFKEEGGFFTFITGRMPFFATHLCELLQPNAPFGCINGGGIYDYSAKKYLWTRKLPSEVIELVAYVDREMPGMGIQLNTFENTYFCTDNAAMVDFRRRTGLPDLRRRLNEVEEPLAKIVFVHTEDKELCRLESLLRAHPKADHFDFVRSEKTIFEILPLGSHKGVALEKMAEILNASKTVAVGDYNNDIGMLRAASLGIAVSNATEEVKRVADAITVSNEEHAIAKIISDLAAGNLAFS